MDWVKRGIDGMLQRQKPSSPARGVDFLFVFVSTRY
jgi:hypothetical protein